MKDKIRLFIADSNEDYAMAVSSFFKRQDIIKEVKTVVDGQCVISEILEFKPDIALIALELSGVDGLKVLERFKEFKDKGVLKTKFIVVSAVSNESVIRRVFDLGVSYFLLKPIDIGLLLERVNDVYEDMYKKTNAIVWGNKVNEEGLERDIVYVLRDLGISPSILGYRYIKEAVLLAVKDFGVLDYVTKELYPTIAKKYGTTPQRVERAMRHAIEVTCSKCDIDILSKYFGNVLRSDSGKVTNSTFIATLADGFCLERSIV